MLRPSLMLISLMALSACANFYPNEKVASYDPETGMTLPHPCPDWSQSQTSNYLNANHSNFGCAVNRNSALQLDDPNDMVMGHGDKNPDTGITSGVITRYRAGELPVPLVPVQGSDSGGE